MMMIDLLPDFFFFVPQVCLALAGVHIWGKPDPPSLCSVC